jgi:uncharacterized protein (DUF1800 family)
MLKVKEAAIEKLVLFLHDHIPSSADAVGDVGLLARQNATFRIFGLGSFRDLLIEVTRDPAMLEFLDGFRNRSEAPNENYPRELMELFALGAKDVNGVDNYTQADVVELARALTGFGWDDWKKRKAIVVRSWAHDAGDKVIFAGKPHEMAGALGVQDFDGNLFPANRNVIDALFAHRDSDGRPTLARFITRKLWEWYAYPDPPLALVDGLADIFVQSGYVVRELLTAILTHDEFYSDAARTSTAKTPVDFVLQALQALSIKPKSKVLPGTVSKMGMELFNPPGVNGWSHGANWLATSSYLARFEFAQAIADQRDSWFKMKASKLVDTSTRDATQVVDDLLAKLGITVPSDSRQALVDHLEGGAALSDEDWYEIKFMGLFGLLLTLPEFQFH